MPEPAVTGKKKKRSWILYAAGAGALLALLVLLLKSKKSTEAEGETTPVTTAAEGVGGASPGEGGAFTDALTAFETQSKEESAGILKASQEENAAISKASQEGLATLSAGLTAGLQSLAASQAAMDSSLESQYSALATTPAASQTAGASTSSAGSPVVPPTVVSVKQQPTSGSGNTNSSGEHYETVKKSGKTFHYYPNRKGPTAYVLVS